MKSMTGYGNHNNENKDYRIEFSIKSVNGRFLESRFHLPKEYLAIESELKKVLSGLFQRGTVDVFCFRKSKHNSSVKVDVDLSLARKIHSEMSKLKKEFKLNSEVNLRDVMSVGQIFKIHEDHSVSKLETQLAIKTFKEALDKCHKERVREGHSIRKELLNHLNLLGLEIISIKKLSDVNAKDNIARLKEKVKSKSQGVVLDEAKIQQEVFFLMEKADIAEEIQRLEEHLKNYKNLLLSKNSEGKKIDFYTQELLREINTVGSKSQNSKITHHIVEAKGLIEKLREQAQNIE